MAERESLFSGNVSPTLCANILHCYWRIAQAIHALPREGPDSAYRSRWTIGLYYEVVSLLTLSLSTFHRQIFFRPR